MKTNPLDHIKIASPCSADWDEMRGDNRKRFCSHCKLNVYNLSEMTRLEAENLLFEMEGKMCVRLYKRNDGTVITQDCPVGWQAIKQRVSRTAKAAFGLIVGFFGGIWSFNQLSNAYTDSVQQIANDEKIYSVPNFEENEIIVKEGNMTYEKPSVFVGRVSDKPIAPKNTSHESGIDFTLNGGIGNEHELMWIFSERYPKDSK